MNLPEGQAIPELSEAKAAALFADPDGGPPPVVGIITGSSSDWEGCMRAAAETLRDFGVSFEARV